MARAVTDADAVVAERVSNIAFLLRAAKHAAEELRSYIDAEIRASRYEWAGPWMEAMMLDKDIARAQGCRLFDVGEKAAVTERSRNEPG